MVKRKWLWGKSSSDTETSASMSSDNYSQDQDQEASKGSPRSTHSPEALSITTNSAEVNDSVPSLTQQLSNVLAHDDFKQLLLEEKASNVVLQHHSRIHLHASVDEDSTNFMNDTKGDEPALEPTTTDQQHNGNLKVLSDNLSSALLNVSLKDDLIKQHSEAAQEAVAGWETAEKQADGFKRQLEDALQSKSSLEARVSHLDGALKECVRQLRLGRDEQERKIALALAEKTKDLEVVNSNLQDQLVELQALVETSRLKSPDPDLQYKLELLERENTALRQQLQSQSEELEVRTIERDLSAKAAETTSKQNLESIKNVAKLEAECRKLKSFHRMSSLSNDHRPTQANSSYSESLTDSQSDGPEQLSASESDNRRMNGWGSHECNPRSSGSWASALIAELDQFKSDKVVDRSLHSSVDINLMDDFLEMERLAALPDTSPQISVGCDQTSEKSEPEMENNLRAQLNSLAHRTGELEEYISRLEVEKAKVEEYACRIEAEKAELEEIMSRAKGEKGELEMALDQTQKCLENSEVQLMENQIKLELLERNLKETNESKQYYKTLANSREHEAELMSSRIKSLLADMDRALAVSEEKSSRCKELEDNLKKKEEEQLVMLDLFSNNDSEMKEIALAEMQACSEKSLAQLKEAEAKLQELGKELHEAAEEKKYLISELDGVRALVDTMSTQIESLNQRVQQEQVLVAELSIKVKELESELQEKRQELDDAQQRVYSNELKIKQEDLAEAAGKLVDCQKTIASLGNQLKSLATLEDFLIDTASISGLSPPATLMARRSGEPWRLHSNGTFLLERGLEPLSPTREGISPVANQNGTTTSGFFSHHPASERNGCGYGKYS